LSSLRRAFDVLRAALRSSTLRRLLLAYFAFEIVEMAGWVLLLVVAYQRSGATAAGVIAVAQLVPAAIVAPLGTALAERMHRRNALLVSYGSLSVTMLAIALSLGLDAPTWSFVLGAVAMNCTITVCRPAHYAALPGLAASPGELVAANSASTLMTQCAAFIGPVSLPLLFQFLAPAGVFVALAFVGLIAVVTVVSVRFAPEADAPVDESGEAAAFVDDALGGLRELASIPGALLLLGLLALLFVEVGSLDVLGVVFPQEALGLGPDSSSVLLAAPGLGGLVGAAFTVVLVTRRRMTPALLVGFCSFGLFVAGIGATQALPPAVILAAGAGAARAFVDVANRTLLQRVARAVTLTRVFGVQESVYMGGLALGALISPILIHSLGVRWAFAVVGLVPVVVTLGSWPVLRRLDEQAVLPDPDRLALLRGVAFFGGLPQPQLEVLARAVVPVPVAAAAVVVEEGDRGDDFYVIQAGRVRIVRDGREVAVSGPGEWFGEVALLHDVPRNATVTAIEPTDLLALDRATFLAVVVGHPEAHEEARRIAEQRRSPLDPPSGA
jgi:MFS family permease